MKRALYSKFLARTILVTVLGTWLRPPRIRAVATDRGVCCCCGMWVCFCLATGAGPGAFAAATNAPAAKSAATNAAPLAVPQSVFVVPKSRAEGVDPFFPLSTRLDVVETSTTNRTAAVGELVVKGFSGTTTSPLVVINDRTFGVGDQNEVATSVGRVRVRCIEIHLKDESVIVEANNERRELRFGKSK